MSYTSEDLELLEPLLNPEQRDGTAYFELHPNELPYPHACWLPGSFFLHEAAFDFFSKCFQAACASFDQYAFQRFGEEELIRLVSELESFLLEITNSTSRERLFSRYASMFRPETWDGLDTNILAPKVYECGEKMLSFVKSNTQESKCLWVLGM